MNCSMRLWKRPGASRTLASSRHCRMRELQGEPQEICGGIAGILHHSEKGLPARVRSEE